MAVTQNEFVNRAEIAPRRDIVGRLGVDTLGISFRAEEAFVPPGYHNHAGWYLVRNGHAWCELSLPRRRDGDNLVPVAGRDAKALVGALVDDLRHVMTPCVGELQEVRITRLDVACNLRATAIPDLLLLMATSPRTHRRWPVHLSCHLGGPLETIAVGPAKAWRLTAYDKGVESGDERARGLLRVEARVRRSALATKWFREGVGALTSVADIEDDKIAACLHTVFVRAGMRDTVPLVPGSPEFFEFDWSGGVVDLHR